MTEKYYYQLYLQIVLRGADYVFGYINVSHIPYEKFYELFQDQVTTETFLFEDVSYFIDEELYQKNKVFLDKEVSFTFDFDLFEYSIGLTGDPFSRYIKDYYEELPPAIKRK